MARRQIGQESLSLGVDRKRSGCLNELACVIDWSEIDQFLGNGEVLEVFVKKRRDRKAALKFLSAR